MRRFIALTMLHVTRSLGATRRWLFVLVYHGALAFFTSVEVLAAAKKASVTPTIWDAAIDNFSRPLIFQLATLPVFLFLITNLPIISRFDEMILLRVQRRTTWWLSLVGTSCALAWVFVGLQLLVVLACATPTSAIEPVWSGAVFSLYEPADMNQLRSAGEPLFILCGTLVLYMLSLIAVGSVTLLASHLSQAAAVGFFAGLVVNLTGLGLYRGDFTFALPDVATELIVFSQHAFFLLVLRRGQPDQAFDLLLRSTGYWLAWIVTFTSLGLLISRRYDIIADGPRAGRLKLADDARKHESE